MCSSFKKWPDTLVGGCKCDCQPAKGIKQSRLSLSEVKSHLLEKTSMHMCRVLDFSYKSRLAVVIVTGDWDTWLVLIC